MDLLLANTRLESSFPVNLVLLGRDGRPRQKNLKQVIEEWIAFRFATVTRRTQHRLGEVDRRVHILEGRQIALLSIDKVIRIIRKAEDPKTDLMAAFGLTEIQADDILEIRLRQLARLEGIKIDNELKALKAERKSLKHVLADDQALSDLVIAEIEAAAAKVRRPAPNTDRSGGASGRQPHRSRRTVDDNAVAARLDPVAPGSPARCHAVFLQGGRRRARGPGNAKRQSDRGAGHQRPGLHDPRRRTSPAAVATGCRSRR